MTNFLDPLCWSPSNEEYTAGDAFYKGQETERARNLKIAERHIEYLKNMLPEKTSESLITYTAVVCALLVCDAILREIEEDET